MRGTSRVIRCAMHLIREFFLKFGRLLAFRPGRAVAAGEFVGGGLRGSPYCGISNSRANSRGGCVGAPWGGFADGSKTRHTATN